MIEAENNDSDVVDDIQSRHLEDEAVGKGAVTSILKLQYRHIDD
jgi:hypothetical protein